MLGSSQHTPPAGPPPLAAPQDRANAFGNATSSTTTNTNPPALAPGTAAALNPLVLELLRHTQAQAQAQAGVQQQQQPQRAPQLHLPQQHQLPFSSYHPNIPISRPQVPSTASTLVPAQSPSWPLQPPHHIPQHQQAPQGYAGQHPHVVQPPSGQALAKLVAGGASDSAPMRPAGYQPPSITATSFGLPRGE